jgi:hypothetical protein
VSASMRSLRDQDSAFAGLQGLRRICEVILVPPNFALQTSSFVLLTVTSQNGCGKCLSVSNCVLRPSEVARENLVSVTKHGSIVLALR